MTVESEARARDLPAGRKALLAAHVAEAGQVTVSALADRFGVSADTIRRDLDQLSSEGMLVRTYGGAVSAVGGAGGGAGGAAGSRVDRHVEDRRTLQTAEKEVIAELAAALVQDGSTIMINGGTTAVAVARALRHHRDLTVATNNLLVPPALPSSAVRDIYVFGGAVRSLTLATIGPMSLPVAGGGELDIHCDLAIIGVGAVAVDAGYTTSNIAEATMMREMMSRAATVAVVADSSKFQRRLLAQIADLGAADHLVTDSAPPPELLQALTERDVRVITPPGA